MDTAMWCGHYTMSYIYTTHSTLHKGHGDVIWSLCHSISMHHHALGHYFQYIMSQLNDCLAARTPPLTARNERQSVVCTARENMALRDSDARTSEGQSHITNDKDSQRNPPSLSGNTTGTNDKMNTVIFTSYTKYVKLVSWTIQVEE